MRIAIVDINIGTERVIRPREIAGRHLFGYKNTLAYCSHVAAFHSDQLPLDLIRGLNINDCRYLGIDPNNNAHSAQLFAFVVARISAAPSMLS